MTLLMLDGDEQFDREWGLAEWVAHLGGDATLVAEHFAGQEIYYPEKVSPSGKFAQIFGFEIAAKLASVVGGGRFYVPYKSQTDVRTLTLLLTHAKFTTNSIVSIANISGRHVYRIRCQWREAGFLPSAQHRGNSPKGAN